MVDNRRIKTGYDIELLLGNNFFQSIINEVYNSGAMENEIELDNDLILRLGQPNSLKLHEDIGAGNADIIVPFTVLRSGIPYFSHDAIVSIRITITEGFIQYEYSLLDSGTIQLIRDAESTLNQPGLLASVSNHLNQTLYTKIDFPLDEMELQKLDVEFLRGTDGYQDALGIYVNLIFCPTLSFGHRGDLSKRLSFLPKNRTFAVGVGKETFERYETTAIHRIFPFEKHPDDDRLIHAIQVDDKTIGEMKSLDVKLKRRFIQIKFKGEVWVDWWPDADVNIEIRITPSIQDRGITAEYHLYSVDIDTGLFAEFLAAYIGWIALGPHGTFIALTELDHQENKYVQKITDNLPIDSGSFGSAFAVFPFLIEFDSDNIDPFYYSHYFITNRILELKLDRRGLSYAGDNVVSYIYRGDESVTIIDKERFSQGPWDGIISLTYRTDSDDEIIMPIHEVIERRANDKIAQVKLRITNIYRKESIVRDVRFNSGLELRVHESVSLQDATVLEAQELVLVHKYTKADGTDVDAHYRAYPGPELNFEELPEFTPSE